MLERQMQVRGRLADVPTRTMCNTVGLALLVLVLLSVRHTLPLRGSTSRRGAHTSARLLVLPAALWLSLVTAVSDLGWTFLTIVADGLRAIAARFAHATDERAQLTARKPDYGSFASLTIDCRPRKPALVASLGRLEVGWSQVRSSGESVDGVVSCHILPWTRTRDLHWYGIGCRSKDRQRWRYERSCCGMARTP